MLENRSYFDEGVKDIISDGVRVKINRTGNAGMTVGGTVDVLAGLKGAPFAIATDPFKAATARLRLSIALQATLQGGERIYIACYRLNREYFKDYKRFQVKSPQLSL